MTAVDALRAGVLRAHGATAPEVDELLAYTASAFAAADDATFPLADEPFVEVWAEYAAEAVERGAAAVLRERLVQLRFPVAAGTSADDAYRRATRRGEAAWLAGGPRRAARTTTARGRWRSAS
jgi:hypothetical protein